MVSGQTQQEVYSAWNRGKPNKTDHAVATRRAQIEVAELEGLDEAHIEPLKASLGRLEKRQHRERGVDADAEREWLEHPQLGYGPL